MIRTLLESLEITNKMINSYEFLIANRLEAKYFSREGKLGFVNTIMFLLNFVKKSLQLELNKFQKLLDKTVAPSLGSGSPKIKLSSALAEGSLIFLVVISQFIRIKIDRIIICKLVHQNFTQIISRRILMNNNRYFILFFATAIILVCALVGYGIYINTASTAHVEKRSAAHYARVHTTKVSYRDITPTIYINSLRLTPAWILDVYAKIDGTLAALYVQPGDKLKKDQVIGELINDELPSQIHQVEGTISGDQTKYAWWDAIAARYQLLVKAGAISVQQLEEALANRDAAAAAIASGQAHRNQLVARLKNQKILAPQDGDVLKIYHAPGTYLGTGHSVIMMGDFSSLFANLDMDNNQLERLFSSEHDKMKMFIPVRQNITKAYASSYKASDAFSSTEFDLVFSKIEPPLAEKSRYRSLICKIDNSAAILEPVTYYHVKIYAAEPRPALTIPKEALLEKEDAFVLTIADKNSETKKIKEGARKEALLEKEDAFVFIVVNEHLEKRKIKIGAQDDYFIEVLEGLKENDVVVVSGKAGLTTGTRVHTSE